MGARGSDGGRTEMQNDASSTVWVVLGKTVTEMASELTGVGRASNTRLSAVMGKSLVEMKVFEEVVVGEVVVAAASWT